MSNWDDFDARDFTGTSVPIGARAVDGVRHMTAVEVGADILASTSLSLTTTPTTITIDPTATYAIIDIGADHGVLAFGVLVSGRWRSGGSVYAVPAYPALRDGARLSRLDRPGSPSYTTIPFLTAGSTLGVYDDGGRVFAVPVAGMHSIDVKTSAGSITGVNVTQRAGPLPSFMTATPQGSTTGGYPSWAATGAYTAGQTIGPTALVLLGHYGARLAPAQPILRQITLGDYAGEIGDFDIIIAQADTSSPLADKAAFDIDYPEYLIGWLEVRATPSSSDQYKLRDFGATGGKGAIINGLSMWTDYIDLDIPTSKAQAAAITLVARGSFTFSSPTTIWGVCQFEL